MAVNPYHSSAKQSSEVKPHPALATASAGPLMRQGRDKVRDRKPSKMVMKPSRSIPILGTVSASGSHGQKHHYHRNGQDMACLKQLWCQAELGIPEPNPSLSNMSQSMVGFMMSPEKGSTTSKKNNPCPRLSMHATIPLWIRICMYICNPLGIS